MFELSDYCYDESDIEEPPCIGLDPDTDPCPFCGAWLSDECKHQLGSTSPKY